MIFHRDKSADGFVRRLRSYILQRFEGVWHFLEKVPFAARVINKVLINTAVTSTRSRPHPSSTLSPYTSWQSLTDKSYFARHLPASATAFPLPPIDDVLSLFHRDPGKARQCPKSTLLFPVFAQYLTDGFLRTEMNDRTRTTSNHEIDLSPLYGRTKEQTDALRTRQQDASLRGRLKFQGINGEIYPPFLFEEDGKTVRPEFCNADGKPLLDAPLGFDAASQNGYERQIFAVGGDRVNATPMVSMLNTLFLREHNRLAAELTARNPTWDDEQVFQTARSILIVIFIKVVIEEYINHISSACFKLRAEPAVAWKAKWNRPNWMTVEFALLYRWHSMVPDDLLWNDATIPATAMLHDNRHLTSVGMQQALFNTSTQNACALGVFNTPTFLTAVEKGAILQGRNLNVQTYNSYRRAMGLRPVSDFAQMTGDSVRQKALSDLYGAPDRLEFYVGLFAEDVNANTPMPLLIGVMVALDAFSQALTNPLMSEHVYNSATFTDWGMTEVGKPQSIAAIARRQLGDSANDLLLDKVRMTRKDWQRIFDRF
ncbi:animal heme peroxidase protein (plasmid) [Rhizobium etli bv. mimosae str. IE4771]|uniref:Animal heme peroxidase protein n=1 Tax=Rhizobium etli bv. mimosae str. IE4771 TaxID=1432050 RepID=A0A060ICM4_RHIET|nr:peroxidase family protein [Rhizobium sp. IE4771]AIC29820.1 animal heme peroxidase protein [Rhizobium sp. IE4771]